MLHRVVRPNLLLSATILAFIISVVRASLFSWSPKNDAHSFVPFALQDIRKALTSSSSSGLDSIASLLRQLDLWQEGKSWPTEQIPLTATAKAYNLVMPMPGHNPQSVHLDLAEGGTVLKISGKLATDFIPPSAVGDREEVRRQATGKGKFVERMEGLVALPWDANVHEMVAAIENGVLKVRIPRRKIPSQIEHIPVHDSFAEIEAPSFSQRAMDSIKSVFGAGRQPSEQESSTEDDRGDANESPAAHPGMMDRVRQAADSITGKVSNILHPHQTQQNIDAQELQSQIEQLQKTYKTAMKSASDSYASMTDAARESASSVFASITQAARYAAGNAIPTDIQKKASGIYSKASDTVASSVPSAFSQATQTARQAGEYVYNQGAKAGEQAYNKASKVGEQAYNKASKVGEQAYSTASRAGEQAYHTAAEAGEKVYDKAKEMYDKAGDSYTQATDSVRRKGESAYNTATRQMAQATDAVKRPVERGYERAADSVNSAYEYAADSVNNAYEYAADSAEKAYERAAEGVQWGSQAASRKAAEGYEAAYEAAKSVPGQAASAFSQATEAVRTGPIGRGYESVTDAAASAAASATQAVSSKASQGYEAAKSKGYEAVKSAPEHVAGAFAHVTQAMKKQASMLFSDGENMAARVSDTVSSVATDATEKVKDGYEYVTDKVKSRMSTTTHSDGRVYTVYTEAAKVTVTNKPEVRGRAFAVGAEEL